MPPNNNRFDDVMAKYETPRNLVCEFIKLFQSNPRAAREVARDIMQIAGLDVPKTPGDGFAGVYEKVCKVFSSLENEPLTKEEIAKRAGLSDWNIHALLYRADEKVNFVVGKNPLGGKAKVYSLTEAAYEAARKAGEAGSGAA